VRTNARTKVLKELVRESKYVVDPAAVAEAIIARSVARQILLDVSSRGTPSVPRPRSFGLHRGGWSFRLNRPRDEQDSSRVR
jgi:hypothetical protein